MIKKAEKVRRTLTLVLFLNIIVASSKVIIGLFSNTISMVADGLHSTFDASSNLIGLISVKFAYDPPDEEHQFGHRKYEVIAALMISFFLFFTSFEILQSVIQRLIFPEVPSISWLNYGVMIVTIFINYFTYRYEYKRGHAINSPVLISDALHTKSDLFVSFSVASFKLIIASAVFSVLKRA